MDFNFSSSKYIKYIFLSHSSNIQQELATKLSRSFDLKEDTGAFIVDHKAIGVRRHQVKKSQE